MQQKYLLPPINVQKYYETERSKNSNSINNEDDVKNCMPPRLHQTFLCSPEHMSSTLKQATKLPVQFGLSK